LKYLEMTLSFWLASGCYGLCQAAHSQLPDRKDPDTVSYQRHHLKKPKISTLCEQAAGLSEKPRKSSGKSKGSKVQQSATAVKAPRTKAKETAWIHRLK
jgi:hypothetical protein